MFTITMYSLALFRVARGNKVCALQHEQIAVGILWFKKPIIEQMEVRRPLNDVSIQVGSGTIARKILNSFFCNDEISYIEKFET